MKYFSTRNINEVVSPANAIVLGIASDGGLFVPDDIPHFDLNDLINCNSFQLQTKIINAFFPDIPHVADLVEKAYFKKFETAELTPTKKVGKFNVLELYHGPTYAFKDVALCMLPQLLSASIKVLGHEKPVRILTATSGDTGKAALSGFANAENLSICVFFPYDGVSDIQRKQMITQRGNNVHVAAVKGNFDDIQSMVKKIFVSSKNLDLNYNLTSANSINIGRLVPQIMYYFKSYKDLVDREQISFGDHVNFSVPTGNFGDILAGFLAKQIGLPIKKLICASNENKVLTDFYSTGIYDKNRDLVKTSSPSMDILISSNLERLLYFLCKDDNYISEIMKNLESTGKYQVNQEIHNKIKDEFWATYCDNFQTQNCITNVWNNHNYLIDPHTACGWFAAEKYVDFTGDNTPMIVLSTASPYKFCTSVLGALGANFEQDGFSQMEQLNKISGVPIPKNLANLKNMNNIHNNVIEVSQMKDFSLA